MKKPLEPPQWFLERDYSWLRDLDAAGWLNELEKAAAQMWAKESREIGEPTFAEEWNHCRGERGAAIVPAFIGPPVVDIVEHCNSSELSSLEKPSIVVRIYLRATDRDIVSRFKRVLVEVRKDCPAPVQKRGPKAPNGYFDAVVFERWLSMRIIELWELTHWSWQAGASAKEADFGRWLFPKREPHKTVHKARAKLYEAIKAIPALTIQVDGERNERRLAEEKALANARLKSAPN